MSRHHQVGAPSGDLTLQPPGCGDTGRLGKSHPLQGPRSRVRDERPTRCKAESLGRAGSPSLLSVTFRDPSCPPPSVCLLLGAFSTRVRHLHTRTPCSLPAACGARPGRPWAHHEARARSPASRAQCPSALGQPAPRRLTQGPLGLAWPAAGSDPPRPGWEQGAQALCLGQALAPRLRGTSLDTCASNRAGVESGLCCGLLCGWKCLCPQSHA